MGRYLLMVCLLFAMSFRVSAQEQYTLSGHIHDAATGEALIGVACQIRRTEGWRHHQQLWILFGYDSGGNLHGQVQHDRISPGRNRHDDRP